MNISKDGRTLYFSDEEIDNDTNGENKVFVTKRINGQESHVKAEKINLKHPKRKETNNDEAFNFNNEIVIGVNVVEEKENHQKGNQKRKKGKKRTDPKLPKKQKKGQNGTDPKLPKNPKRAKTEPTPNYPKNQKRQKRNTHQITQKKDTSIYYHYFINSNSSSTCPNSTNFQHYRHTSTRKRKTRFQYYFNIIRSKKRKKYLSI